MITSPQPRRPRAIFEEAIELSTMAERMEFARRECGDDAALFEQVRALLEADAAAASFLPDAPPPDPVSAALPQQPGDVIGRYRLAQKIGEGGCGAVYLAEQHEPVRRSVALKVIKLGMDTQSVIARFEAERQALALMDHPNIARVFDAGATAGGRPYFVMEWVDGRRITQYCDEHRLPPRDRLELFIQVCLAVQHAHQKGVIHRDLKPSNILVAAHDGRPVPKLIDFGIAKAMQGRLTDKTIATQLQSFLGTPAYMSPEQADLGASDIDTRADIYSLGVVLYELITGEPPFDGEALLQSGLEELRRTLREVDPPTPSKRLESSRMNPSGAAAAALPARRTSPFHPLPADLDWIVMKCLEKDRARRYESASGLAQDIRRHLDDEPVAARPPSRTYRLQKLVRRNRVVFSALSATAAVLVGAVIISASQAIRARRAERFEHEQRQRAERSERAALEARERSRQQAYSSDIYAASHALERDELGLAVDLLRAHFPQAGQTDLRGLEWRYLWQAARGQESRSIPTSPSVYSCRLAPDGKHFALACFGGEIQIRETDTGRVTAAFPGSRENNIRDRLAYSPDGSLFVASEDGRVLVRDTGNWRVVRELPGGCESMAFSANGRVFARLLSQSLEVFRLPEWEKQSAPLPSESGWARLALDSEGRHLAMLRRSRDEVEVWEVDSLQKLASFGGGVGPLSVALSPDGRQLAIGDSPGDVRVWDVATRTGITTNRAHGRWVYALTFSPDGRRLASGGGDNRIGLWDAASLASTRTLELLQKLRGHHREIWSLQFSRDGHQLISSGRENAVKLWNVFRPAPSSSRVNLPSNTMWLGFLADPREGLLLSAAPHALRVLDLASNRFLRTNDVAGRQGAVAFDGVHATYGTTNGRAVTWSAATGRRVRDISLTKGPLLALQASSDLRYLLGLDKAQELATVWNLETGERVATLPDFALAEMVPTWSTAQRAAFSPDGRWLAYAGSNHTVKLWEAPTRREASTLRGHTWHIQCLRFSPDGRRLVTGSWDSQVRLWDVAAGRESALQLKPHLTAIGNVAFSPCGRTLLVRTGDDVLHFHSLANGASTLVLPNVTAWFFNMLSPDGNALTWQAGNGSEDHPLFVLPTLEEIDRGER